MPSWIFEQSWDGQTIEPSSQLLSVAKVLKCNLGAMGGLHMVFGGFELNNSMAGLVVEVLLKLVYCH